MANDDDVPSTVVWMPSRVYHHVQHSVAAGRCRRLAKAVHQKYTKVRASVHGLRHRCFRQGKSANDGGPVVAAEKAAGLSTLSTTTTASPSETTSLETTSSAASTTFYSIPSSLNSQESFAVDIARRAVRVSKPTLDVVHPSALSKSMTSVTLEIED